MKSTLLYRWAGRMWLWMRSATTCDYLGPTHAGSSSASSLVSALRHPCLFISYVAYCPTNSDWSSLFIVCATPTCSPRALPISGVGLHLTAILGNGRAYPEGLVGQGMGLWDVGKGYLSPLGEGARPLPRNKWFFSLEMACFGAFWAVFFVRVVARKMLNFSPEVVIWGTLKINF